MVATSALGMGYDKADLTFVVHYQAPGSVISYYQQVGRAGRGVEHADIVLLRGDEDRRIQDFFIEQAFPGRERVRGGARRARAATRSTGLTTRELMPAVNLGLGRLEAMLKILDVEGAVRREGSRWVLVPGSDWSYDGERYAQVTALRRERAGGDGRVRRRRALPDARAAGGARRPRCPRLRPLLGVHRRRALISRRPTRWSSRPGATCAPSRSSSRSRRWRPIPSGAMRKIPDDVRVEPGWALARFGDGGWWPAVERGLTQRHLRARRRRSAGRRGPAHEHGGARWITHVPSTRVDEHAERAGRAGRRRSSGSRPLTLLTRREARPPQREMANAAQQVANVRGAFAVTRPPPRSTGVLLDDRRHSGWTLAMVGGQLRRAGAERVIPLALGTLT